MFNPVTVLFRPITLDEALWLLAYGWAGVTILHLCVMAILRKQAHLCDSVQAEHTDELY